MVVVGPEAPLVAGLANDLVKAGIPTFGPSSEAAALEGSKDFMKKLCDKYNIPTAKVRLFTFMSNPIVFLGLWGLVLSRCLRVVYATYV